MRNEPDFNEAIGGQPVVARLNFKSEHVRIELERVCQIIHLEKKEI
jgi:hypothetical protein